MLRIVLSYQVRNEEIAWAGDGLGNSVEGICGWAEAGIEQVQAVREVYA